MVQAFDMGNSGSSDRQWFHYLRKGEPEDDQLVQEGISANIRTGRDVENHVRVIASGDTGWLFVNGGYEAELDLSGLVESGSVSLTGAWFRGTSTPGAPPVTPTSPSAR